MTNTLKIELLPGDFAPRYSKGEYCEVKVDKVVITEQGTQGGLPIVDFQMTGDGDRKFYMVMTGRLVNSLAAAIQGVNVRNHGKAEP